MSIQNVYLQCTGTPDDQAMKAQLSAIYGVVEMNIDSKSHGVEVRFDDAYTSPEQISSHLHDKNYRLQQ